MSTASATVDLAKRGALAWAGRITAHKEGVYWVVTRADLGERPTEWLSGDEVIDDNLITVEVPF